MSAPGDVHVVPDRLAASAWATRELADTLHSMDLAGPMRQAGTALSGSATAEAAVSLAARWSGSVAAVTDALTKQAAGLEASAEAYRRSDGAIADALRDTGPATPRLGPEPGAITRALG